MKLLLVFFLSVLSYSTYSSVSCESKVKDIIFNQYKVSEADFNRVSFKDISLKLPEGIERDFQMVTYDFDSEVKIFLVTYSAYCQVESVSQIVQQDQ